MKTMLVLKASEDVSSAEIDNVVTQTKMYGIEHDIYEIRSIDDLFDALNTGKRYDYLFLATHGCETSWGNISGTLNVKWIDFAALVCMSGVTKPGSVFLHSCCRGGLTQVAHTMFACCDKIEFVCGPRYNIRPVDLVTAFNLFLYQVEIRKIYAVIAADKILQAVDLKLMCYDKVETKGELSYQHFRSGAETQIRQAFEDMRTYQNKRTIAALASAATV